MGILLFLHYNYYYLAAEDASASLYIRLGVVYTIARIFFRMAFDNLLQNRNDLKLTKLQYGNSCVVFFLVSTGALPIVSQEDYVYYCYCCYCFSHGNI